MAKPKDYFHHEQIYRKDVLDKIANLHVTVCGAGAIGSNLIENMARQGFSRLRAIDMDRVEKHNINTQVYHRGNVGALKVAALKSIIYQAVEVEIETEAVELTDKNIKKLLRKTDLVVDAFDNSASRRLITDYCLANNIECLHVGLNTDYAEVIWNKSYRVPQDVEGDVCDYPLARNIALLSAIVATEEIISFSANCSQAHTRRNFNITLKDLKIRSY